MSTTSVKFFHSAQVNAPVVQNAPGHLVALLDACLVNGFGLQSVVSATVAGGVATLTFGAAHAFHEHSVALIAGAGTAALNGEHRVSVPSAISISYPVAGVADGIITGAVSAKVAPLGWSKTYADTNLAAYRITDPAGSGFYLRVDDTSTGYATVAGFESMSDVNTGAGQFPTADMAPSSAGYFWGKNLAGTVPAEWMIIGDERLFYFWITSYHPDATYGSGYCFAFGDIARANAADTFACWLSGAQSGELNSSSYAVGALGYLASAVDASYTSKCLARSYTGIGSRVRANESLPGLTTNYIAGTSANQEPYPNPADNSLAVLPDVIYESASRARRGSMPGLYLPAQQIVSVNPFQTGDLVTGITGLDGRTLKTVKSGGPASSGAGGNIPLFFDITGPWR